MTDQVDDRKTKSSKTIFSSTREYLTKTVKELNLYSDDPFWSPNLKYLEQIISTRLFIFFIILSLCIVLIYSSLLLVNHEVTLDKFTFEDFEHYEKLYPHTINVPCSSVSIPYNKFLNVSPIFHEVCSSSFISQKWISSLFLFNSTSHNILDYRTFAFAHFRSLKLLCRIGRQAVQDAHRTFNFTNLITRNAFSRDQFDEVSLVLFNNLRQNLLTNEKQTVEILSMITAQNRLISALRTNFYIQSEPGSRSYATYNAVYLKDNQSNDSICDCQLQGNQCFYPAGAFYNWTEPELSKPAKNFPPPKFQIPGLMAGCLPLDSIRQSTLECLYNQSCVNAISPQQWITAPKALNRSLTRFSLNATIGSIFNQSLFVESWQNQSNFRNYYDECAPQTLSFSYQKRFHIGTIITLTISAFGGLMIVWKLVTPLFVKIFRLCKRKKQPPPPPPPPPSAENNPIEQAITNLAPKRVDKVVIQHVHRTISNFNLFPSDNKNDPNEERIGIISTRLFILFSLLGLIGLGLYTVFNEHNQTITIKNPSLFQFEDLHEKYSSTLDCPCTRFSMSYGRIMSIKPQYHSICSSEFLKDYWLSYFGRVEIDVDQVIFWSVDYRINGQSFFNLLQILCKTSNETIENAIRVFKTNRLVTMNALSSKQFAIETHRRLHLFQEQTITSFVLLIQLIRSAIQTNQIAEEIWTNIGPYSTFHNKTSQWSLSFQPRNFYTNSCSCALSNQCTRPVGFYLQTDNARSKPNITVPGLVIGCYAIDSLLLSTLECFYDKSCIQLIIDYYDFDVVDLVYPLNERAKNIPPLSNRTSRFSINTTINEIFGQLFVESWINHTDHAAYYTRCEPSQCTYTVKKRFDLAYMISLMLGFYGGLSAALEIILPRIVKLFFKQKKKPDEQTTVYTITTSGEPPKTVKEQSLYQKCLSLNYFESDPSTANERFENHEKLATRIYIILLLSGMIAGFLYYGPLSTETKTEYIKNPTIAQVKGLHQRNIPTLSCPCSKVDMPYSKFLSIKTEFHPICSSEYVSPSYRLKLFQINDSNSLPLITHYRILSDFCSLSNQFLDNAKKVFDSRELITIETLTNQTFSIEIQSLISSFIRRIKLDYRRTLSFIINSFSTNQFLNLFLKNWEVKFTDKKPNYLIQTNPHRFSTSNCTCAISSNCNEKLIDDIHIGCFPYDGFRLSKYENMSLGKLNMDLFVNQWMNQTNYTNYFQTCHPIECQYTIPNRNDPLYILTSLLGLYGGLDTLLQIVIKQILLAHRWRIER